MEKLKPREGKALAYDPTVGQEPRFPGDSCWLFAFYRWANWDLVTCPNLHSESIAESEPKFECPDFNPVFETTTNGSCHQGLRTHLVPVTKHFTQVGQDGRWGRDQTDRTQTTHPPLLITASCHWLHHPLLAQGPQPVVVLLLASCVVISSIPLKLPSHNIIYHKNNNVMSVKGIFKNHSKSHHPSPTAVSVFLSSSNLYPYVYCTYFYTLVITM